MKPVATKGGTTRNGQTIWPCSRAWAVHAHTRASRWRRGSALSTEICYVRVYPIRKPTRLLRQCHKRSGANGEYPIPYPKNNDPMRQSFPAKSGLRYDKLLLGIADSNPYLSEGSRQAKLSPLMVLYGWDFPPLGLDHNRQTGNESSKQTDHCGDR